MGKQLPAILIEDRYWIPEQYADPDKLERLYRVQVFNEQMCKKCEYLSERVTDVCLECEGFEGDYKLYKNKTIKGKEYVGVPVGNLKKLRRLVRITRFRFIDKREEGKSFKKLGLKFYDEKLYDYQKKATKRLIKRGRGVLKSAPRTGKTVMMVRIALKQGRKVLILAHQADLIKQFIATFRNSVLTNVADKEHFDGRQYVKFCKTYEDFKKYPICLATYQTFISKGGKKLLKKVADLPFGTVAIDEVHRANANCFSSVINAFKAKQRFGLTATPDRKDGKHFIVRDIVGPIVYRTKAQALPLKVDVIETGLHSNKQYRVWNYAMRFLERDEKRTKLIVKQAVKDLKKGRSIVIPVTVQRQNDNLVRLINRAYGKTIAMGFHGKLRKTKTVDDRQKVLDAAISGKKIRCIVATRSMLTGVNVPRWDTVYEIVPINNAPNLEQELLRACTPFEGKQEPLVRWFVDDFQISRSCFVSSVSHMKEMRKRLGGFQYTKRGAESTKKIVQVHYATKSRSGRNWNEDEGPKPWRAKGDGEPISKQKKQGWKGGGKFQKRPDIPWKPISF